MVLVMRNGQTVQSTLASMLQGKKKEQVLSKRVMDPFIPVSGCQIRLTVSECIHGQISVIMLDKVSTA
jgi:hypothetical protein